MNKPLPTADASAEFAYAQEQHDAAKYRMTPEQRAALLVLRAQIADCIDGDSPSDARNSRWCELCDLALGEAIDPWALLFHAPAIKEMKAKL